MNIREIIGFNKPYHTINREERNLAALFYHCLLHEENLQRFCEKISPESTFNESEIAVYYEYSFLRDLWNKIGNNNEVKRKIILDILQPFNRNELEKKSVFSFNGYFGANRALSKKNIASPANWSISGIDKIQDNEEFLSICKFKWCYNAKPDIVIHTTNDHAICIEAKLESRISRYPSASSEKSIFKRRKLETVSQMLIQQEVMRMLGVKTHFILLSLKSENNDNLSWKEAFQIMNIQSLPGFVKEWLKRLEIIE